MDELEISGKRYISSKRIAKENKYHSDYIGQLIRAGKVAGTKVGRAWYVEEASFAEYLNKEHKIYSAPTSAEKPSVVAVAVEETPLTVEVEVKELEEKNIIQLHVMPEEKVEEVFIQESPVETEELDATRVKKTGLTYIADSSPLFPAISRRTRPLPLAVVEEPEEIYREVLVERVSTKRAKESNKNIVVSAFSFFILSGILFAVALYGSLNVTTTVIVEKGKPASVVLSGKGALCFIFKTCQNK
ncbi:MAG: hypothetical protein NT019_00545 [Candidatus Adlerbacteria bacterium]|nr:hypothetical protein [Candidatus Adlerbacteria bacterium]